MRRRLGWFLVALAYWMVVFYFLGSASPVYIDGAGPTPSFWWGNPPLPDLGEYNRHHAYYTAIFLLPYAIVALVLTAIGWFIGPLPIRGRKYSWTDTIVLVASTTLAATVALALVNDVCLRLGHWRGPSFLLSWGHPVFLILALTRTFLPAAVLSGVVELARRELRFST